MLAWALCNCWRIDGCDRFGYFTKWFGCLLGRAVGQGCGGAELTVGSEIFRTYRAEGNFLGRRVAVAVVGPCRAGYWSWDVTAVSAACVCMYKYQSHRNNQSCGHSHSKKQAPKSYP